MSNERVVDVIDILLVEDDPGDVVLTTEALNGSKLTNVVHVTENGETGDEVSSGGSRPTRMRRDQI